jgi:hypothetical protein
MNQDQRRLFTHRWRKRHSYKGRYTRAGTFQIETGPPNRYVAVQSWGHTQGQVHFFSEISTFPRQKDGSTRSCTMIEEKQQNKTKQKTRVRRDVGTNPQVSM